MGGLFSKKITEEDLLDLTGKVAIVTGANSGIGLSTAQFLVRRGAKVYIGARNEGKAIAAISQLEHEGLGGLGGKLEWLDLDLSHPKLAKKAAETFKGKEKRLDILVNNAAMLASPYKLTDDGIVDSMVVNHISPYRFTEALVPLMKGTAAEPKSDVRIVYVSSTTHASPKDVTFKGKESLNVRYGDSFTDNLKRYGLTKLANILHSRELQRRFDAENINITSISLHPGNVASPGALVLVRKFPLGELVAGLTKLLLSDTRDGAMASAFAAAGVDVANNKQKYKGSYLLQYGKYAKSSEQAEDPLLASDLCATTESVLREMGL